MFQHIFHRIKAFLTQRHAEMEEFSLVAPVLLLVTLGLFNAAAVGFSAVTAGNAANYAARMGSVAQSDQASVAAAAAHEMLSGVTVGDYQVAVSGGGAPGRLIRVDVTYRVPNWFGGFAGLFGVSTPPEFGGTVRSHFRQEGW